MRGALSLWDGVQSSSEESRRTAGRPSPGPSPLVPRGEGRRATAPGPPPPGPLPRQTATGEGEMAARDTLSSRRRMLPDAIRRASPPSATPTPPPKLGEGSTAVARNEQKAGGGEGPRGSRCSVSPPHRLRKFSPSPRGNERGGGRGEGRPADAVRCLSPTSFRRPPFAEPPIRRPPFTCPHPRDVFTLARDWNRGVKHGFQRMHGAAR
jgi:hypothetical protein